MRKFALLLGSQLVAPGTVLQGTAPEADTVRDARLALPYLLQYAFNTEFAKKQDVRAEPRPARVANPLLSGC